LLGGNPRLSVEYRHLQAGEDWGSGNPSRQACSSVDPSVPATAAQKARTSRLERLQSWRRQGTHARSRFAASPGVSGKAVWVGSDGPAGTCSFANWTTLEIVVLPGTETRNDLKNPRTGRISSADPAFIRLFPSRRGSGPLWSRLWVVLLLGIQVQLFSTQVRAQSAAAQAGQADSSGVVRPGDVIRLKVWREPDMSGDVPVNEAGMATLPRLGAVQVGDLSADSLQRFLVTTYSRDLRDPAIDVTVLRRIRILGAVRNPNVYQVDPTMTVADALALAGGASPDGKQDQVELRRLGESGATRLTRAMRLADTPIRSGDQLYVPEKNWLSRNSGLVLAGVGTLTSVLYFVFRR
jgi:protein involved in polysaccharide export with SLBB domain